MILQLVYPRRAVFYIEMVVACGDTGEKEATGETKE
jgi:hypothetical protein